MIIQCEQCTTKFRLDDAKVTDKGVKVRCAKCKHVFTVKKEPAYMEQQPDFGTMLDQSAAFGKEDAATSFAPRQDIAGETEPSFAFASQDGTGQAVCMDDFAPLGTPQEETAIPQAGQDEFNLSSLQDNAGFVTDQGETAVTEGTIEFPGFDSGCTAADAGEAVISAPSFNASDAAGSDFGDEKLFGDMTSIPVSEKGADPLPYDFPMSEFSEEKAPDETETLAVTEGVKAEELSSLGEISFGDEQEHKGEDSGEETLKKESASSDGQEELPPLSIASRRKQSPMFTGLVTVLAVALVALLGYVGYSMFFVEKAAKENGRITLRAVNASFVRNSAAGDILVISGEAANEFPKPRAAIQVKGMMYGANGQVLVSKNAYAGNPLTKEQLASMPLEKIEAAMANQFGDSLANLEVAPGKTIPFVIVIVNPPADAKDYGVEPAGSTVATGKQP